MAGRDVLHAKSIYKRTFLVVDREKPSRKDVRGIREFKRTFVRVFGLLIDI